MDKIRALEFLGFVNLVDFEANFDENADEMVITWYSASPEPSLSTMQTAFNDWEASLPVTPLLDMQTAANTIVDVAAERTRQRYLTDGSGQALVYQAKAEDAAKYAADGYPANVPDYPWVEAEAIIINDTAQVAADQILLRRDQWIQLGIEVEKVRLGGKQDIMSAGTENAVNVARDLAVAILDAA